MSFRQRGQGDKVRLRSKRIEVIVTGGTRSCRDAMVF